MEAIFGNHIQWESLAVHFGKGRPLGMFIYSSAQITKSLSIVRKTQLCPLTGLPAKYIDPHTGVPFANAEAFKVLQDIMVHEYNWNPSLGFYSGLIHTQQD